MSRVTKPRRGDTSAWPVAQIAGITYRQLDYWTRTGLVTASITPAAGSGTRRLYSFRDILINKIIASLLDAGLSLKAVRTALTTLADLGVDDLAATTLFSDGTTITTLPTHNIPTNPVVDTPGRGEERPATVTHVA
ncbi:hypothetical protein CXF38_00255 [Corynebacterium bovis]|nr:hypothetical protein CXF38_00255 [Corynebacterium bovis]